MIDNKSYHKILINNERSFGFLLAIVLAVIGLYPLLYNNDIRTWFCLTSFIVIALSIFYPKVFIIPNKLWFKLGILLGAFMAPIVMGIVFFLTITPTGIIMRLLGKDILKQKINKSSKSYWIKRKENIGSMENQF